MSNNKKHNRMVTSIIDRPSLIGLEGVVLSSGETNIFDYEGRLIGKPDGVFFDTRGDWYAMEYKTSDAQRVKAMKQLMRTQEHFKKYNITDDLQPMYVYGDYVVVRLK